MANSLTSNPWVIDTPGATILFNTDVNVEHFEYAGYSVAGAASVCQVKDRFGKLVWSATGASDLQEVRSGKIGWIHGFGVPTLDNGGILRVYFK